MKTLLISLLFILSACGEILETGKYDVSIYYEVDNWPNSLQGESRLATWIISKKAEEYEVQVVGGTLWEHGKEQDGKILFSIYKSYNEKDPDCPVYDKGSIELNPDGNKFTGVGNFKNIVGRYGNGVCDTVDLITVAKVGGTKIE